MDAQKDSAGKAPSLSLQLLLLLLLVVSTSAWLAIGRDGSVRAASMRASRPLMGTLWTIEVVDDGRTEEARVAMDSAFSEVARIERLMSEWIPDSPVSRVNSAAGKNAVAVPSELSTLLNRATDLGHRSKGAFDVTWKGMGSVWRFDDRFTLPTEASVEEARQRVDFRKLEILGDKVYLGQVGMAVGLGGIAKGYAVDRAAAILASAGFPNSLVAGAGDIRASGLKGGRPWKLGIQDPRASRGVLLGEISLSGRAISTSGDYERFRMVDGVRYHHIIDPRTGWPAKGCRAVTVAASSAEQSDSLATAIFVLGPEEGMKLAQSEGVDALIVDNNGAMKASGLFQSLARVH